MSTRAAGRGYPVAGRSRVFAAMTPILPGHVEALRAHLASFDWRDSPLARLPEHHFARWLIVSGFHHNGRRQKADVLQSVYLLFTACFDGLDLDRYLARLRAGLAGDADAVWRHCVGYGGLDDLGRYLRHNEIPVVLPFAECPEASVDDIRKALRRQTQVRDFVLAHQGERDPSALRAAWKEAFHG